MNKDQIKGRIKKAKGTIAEAAGKVSGKESLKQKGKLQKVVGRVQAGYGDIKNAIRKDK